MPEGPRHLYASPGDTNVVQGVLNDLRIGAGVLKTEIAAESVEELAGARGVNREFHGIPVDFPGDLHGEAFPDRLVGREFAGRHGQKDLDIVAALAPVVAHQDAGGLIEHNFDLAARRDQADAAGFGVQILVLFGFASGQRSPRRSRRDRLDELRGTAGEERGGKIQAQVGAPDIGLFRRPELDIDFGRAGPGVFHHFGSANGPVRALLAELFRRAHPDLDGFDLAVAGVAVVLPLPAGARNPNAIGLGHAQAGVEFQQVAVHADARQIAPGHNLGLAGRRAGKPRQQANADCG